MTDMTPKEARKLWTDALRSGEFYQTHTRLSDTAEGEQRFCCLGVACEVYRRATGKGEWLPSYKGSWEFQFILDPDGPKREEFDQWIETKDNNGGCMSPAVRDWLGLSTSGGQFNQVIAGENSLYRLNDGAAFSFEEIADVVDDPPPGLLA